MKGRRQKPRPQYAASPARLQERDAVKPPYLVLNTKLPIEVDKIRAAPEKNVLAVVDDFRSSWMFIRRGASAHIRSALDEMDPISGIRQ